MGRLGHHFQPQIISIVTSQAIQVQGGLPILIVLRQILPDPNHSLSLSNIEFLAHRRFYFHSSLRVGCSSFSFYIVGNEIQSNCSERGSDLFKTLSKDCLAPKTFSSSESFQSQKAPQASSCLRAFALALSSSRMPFSQNFLCPVLFHHSGPSGQSNLLKS